MSHGFLFLMKFHSECPTWVITQMTVAYVIYTVWINFVGKILFPKFLCNKRLNTESGQVDILYLIVPTVFKGKLEVVW